MRFVSVMEWNLNTPSEWDWENLSLFNHSSIKIPKNLQFSSHDTEGNGNVVVDNGLLYSSVDSSSKEREKRVGEINGFPRDYIEKEEFPWGDKNMSIPNMVEASVLSGEAMIGLKLGKQIYCEDMCASSNDNKTTSSSYPLISRSSSSSTMKRFKASYQGTLSPRCQVEGCNLDLASAKDYHRRHRICANHSKSPKIIVAGMERRFCQQCSRFHDLSEFDDRKRSCRRRLSAHNARRRRPHAEDTQFTSALLSSSICDRKLQMNFLVNRISIPVPNPTLDSASNFRVAALGEESLLSLAKCGGIDMKPQISSDARPNSFSVLRLDSDRSSSFQGITPRIENHDLQASSAFSLLSTSSWGLNEPEPISPFDQFVHGNNYISLNQPGIQSQLQNWQLSSSSEYGRVKQTHLQEFHSLKTPHEFESFYSNQTS